MALSLKKRATKSMERLPRRLLVLIYLSIGIGAVLFLIPFYLILRDALMDPGQLYAFHWIWFPWPLHFDNFSKLFNDPDVPMLTGMLNSLFIAVCSVVGQLFFASLAGYALARIPNRFSNVVFWSILVTMMIPGAVTFVPGFVLVSYLGWVSTLQGLIVPTLFSGFATFWFRQHFLNFPRELEDAGRMDGLGFWGVYWRIALPNAKAILMSQATIIFIWNWNSFLWPLVIGQDQSSWTVQIVLSSFVTDQSINLPEVFAGVVVSVIPLLLVFLFFQRYIVEGVARSGIK